ncbi:MAG: hypothetical protein ABIK28_10165, partial [Planctomycetota bacterium]
LKPGGVTAQYLPLHKMAKADFRTALATFTEVFPECALFMGVTHGVMVGGRDSLQFVPERMKQGLASCSLIDDLRMSALDDPVQILGCFLAGGETLSAFARQGPSSSDTADTRLNTDDLPLLDYSGSRGMVHDTWIENMGDLLNLPESSPRMVVGSGVDEMGYAERIRRSVAVKRLLLKGQWHARQGDRAREREAFQEAASMDSMDPEVKQIFGVGGPDSSRPR